MASGTPARAIRYWRWGACCSALLHGGLVITGVAQAIRMLFVPLPDLAAVTIVQVEPLTDERQAELWLTGAEAPSIISAAVDGEELLAGIADPRWEELLVPEDVDDDGDIDVSRDFVAAQVMQIAADAGNRSLDENLARLGTLSERLTDISSHKSVDDINARLRKVLGTEARAERPADEPIAGEFDFGTAQMHDVRRERGENGQWIYTAILVDAAGRRFESPLPADQGETAYRTMQLVKSNPLMEKVYRGIVMSLLDSVLKRTP